MPVLKSVLTLLLAAALIAGCGSDDETAAKPKETAASAILEIGKVRDALDVAEKTYDGGDYKQAALQVGDAYLNHYEFVEGPLGKIDNTLMLKIEKGIRETLRGKVGEAGDEQAVHQLFDTIDADLTTAEGKLK